MRRVLPALLLAIVGCFTDAPTQEGCVEGAAGCPCGPGDACNAGLECRDPGVCVDAGCEAGGPGCVCAQGMCSGGLTCDANGVCVAMDGTGDAGVGADTAVTPPPTSDATVTTTDMMTATSFDPTGGTTFPDDTGVSEVEACYACVIENIDANACAPHNGACDGVRGCVIRRLCAMEKCGAIEQPGLGPCLTGCCATGDGDLGAQEFIDLLICASMRCGEPCGGTLPIPEGCAPPD